MRFPIRHQNGFNTHYGPIEAAITGTLSPYILPIMDLKKMLSHIEETLPPTLHLPVSSEDTLHFYQYLHTHVLIASKQFLLLIDVSIQDQSQQLSIYNFFLWIFPTIITQPAMISTTNILELHKTRLWQFKSHISSSGFVRRQMDTFIRLLHPFSCLPTHQLGRPLRQMLQPLC